MKQRLLILALAFMPLALSGQSASVVSPLQILPNSQAVVSYNNEFGKYENREVDDSFPYAVIRVELEGNGEDVREAKERLGLDLGRMYAVQAVNTSENNCVLFLVPRGVKSVYLLCGDGCEKQLLHSGAALLEDKVYVCKVSYRRENGSQPRAVVASRQYLYITVEPKGAIVTVDGEIVTVEDGVAAKQLSLGKHTYTVESPDYHPQSGEVVVDDPKNKKVLNVSLRPAFGYITIAGDGELNGAAVYVDNKMVGVVPLGRFKVTSGSHMIMLTKSMYNSFQQQVTVEDEQTLDLKPQMVADFATVTLRATEGVEIWANGERKGVGSWSGRLSTGEYVFETRRANHRPVSVKRQITASSSGTITLEAPIPILGLLDVSVKPFNAEVVMDGKQVGTTPLLLQEVLVGSHEVLVRKAGCAERTWQVEVTEGQTTMLEGRLAEGQDVRLSCGVPNAHWTVDGVERGTGSDITVNLSYAEHSVVIKAEKYRDYEEKFTVGTGMESRAFAIQRKQRMGGDVETITVNGVRFNMRRVGGGTFWMGSNDGDDDEKPVHSVTLSDYYIGETEVTQALWETVMGNNPSVHKGKDLPVENVSWNDCQEFIRKLNKLTGEVFTLPTEAQWEIAARGGDKRCGYKYSGSNNLGSVAWYEENSLRETHPVGTKQANELGIYDMSGNVWEWCQDWKGTYNSYSETNPKGPSNGLGRVIRGGSWDYYSRYCRSTDRLVNNPTRRNSSTGLRLVMHP